MTVTPDNERMSLLECNSTMIRRASRHLSRLYDREFAGLGLRTTQVVILALVDGGRCATIPELAEALVMDRSTLGHNLRPLQKAGLVELVPGASDRRKRTVRLTASGRHHLENGYRIWKEAQAKFHSAFGTAEAARMREMMKRVTELTLDWQPKVGPP